MSQQDAQPSANAYAHTNRLIHETSPYLLQHAHNPVDWYPWGEEALAKAKAEDRPILLSVGYSACHWCHVMEAESFENTAIAQLMNELFVPIKVDREERPDIDALYMDAVQALTGRGGWPMTVFLLKTVTGCQGSQRCCDGSRTSTAPNGTKSRSRRTHSATSTSSSACAGCLCRQD